MIIKRIIRNAALYLGLDNVLALPDMGGEEFDESAAAELDVLLRCTNLILKEVASEYMPLVAVEDHRAVGGRIAYTEFGERVADVLEVSGADGRVEFSMRPGYLAVPLSSANLRVRFQYLPRDYALGDVTDFQARVEERIVAYGVVAEYFLVNSRYDDATVFNTRFVNAIGSVATKRSEMRVKGRMWV